MNITELRAQVQAYCENTFPQSAGGVTSTDQINLFIRQAEQRIYNAVQFQALRKNVTSTLTQSSQYASAPNDFLAVYSFAVITGTGDYEYLINKDVSFIRSAYPNPTSTGIPKHYAIFGPTTTNTNPPVITNELSFILGPTPASNYSVELHYYYYPESITTVAGGTTWLSDNFDSVLLYGSLLEAAAYMKESEPEVVGQYTARYNEALALAKQLGEGYERRDAYRSGLPRVPVS
jgi:hypothetical protein